MYTYMNTYMCTTGTTIQSAADGPRDVEFGAMSRLLGSNVEALLTRPLHVEALLTRPLHVEALLTRPLHVEALLAEPPK